MLNQAGDTAEQVANLALFSNVQSSNVQSCDDWSGTAYAPDLEYAWSSYTFSGSQTTFGKFTTLYAVAVRPGDVAAPNRSPRPGRCC